MITFPLLIQSLFPPKSHLPPRPKQKAGIPALFERNIILVRQAGAVTLPCPLPACSVRLPSAHRFRYLVHLGMNHVAPFAHSALDLRLNVRQSDHRRRSPDNAAGQHAHHHMSSHDIQTLLSTGHFLLVVCAGSVKYITGYVFHYLLFDR